MTQSGNENPNPTNGDNNPNGNADADPNANVSRVSIKVPPFWHESPEIWFAQVEAQFGITGTTTDLSKFNTVLAAIESRILTQVSQAVLNPPANDKYKNLKEQILKVYTDSEHKKMSKLLSDMPLGDRKPSQVLNEMRRLGGANITEGFLKTLWLQNLPEQTRAIISASDGDLTTLAALADKVVEVSKAGRVNNVVNPLQCSNQQSETNTSLERKIDALTRAIQALTGDNLKNSRSRSRSTTRFQHRNSRGSTPATPSTKKEHDICWYHRTFGDKSDKCTEPIKPCSYTSKN